MKEKPFGLILKDGSEIRLVQSEDEDALILFSNDDGEFEGRLADAFESPAFRGHSIIVAISSFDCLVSSLEIVDPKMARNRQMLSFVLEEHLPIAAEDFVADFIQTKQQALGIVVEVSEFEPIVQSIENVDRTVHSIVPTSLLAFSSLNQQKKFRGDQVIIWQHELTEFFLLQNSTLSNWLAMQNQPATILQELEHLLPEDETELNLVLVTPTESLLATLSGRISEECTTTLTDVSYRDCLLQGARRIATNKHEPDINLLRPPLGVSDRLQSIRKQLKFAFASAIVLVIAASVFFQVRAHSYERIANGFENQQRTVFMNLFPDTSVPVGIRARLEVELNTRKGLSDMQQLPALDSADTLLTSVLRGLTNDVRFRVRSIRIESDSVDIQGEARSHSDVETIVVGLKTYGFQIEPPRTESLPKEGVSFRLVGQTLKDKEA